VFSVVNSKKCASGAGQEADWQQQSKGFLEVGQRQEYEES
jgi:hypothetical protein